ncbi:ferredoxin [Mycolicibacterium sp.]|uniref:ferredoxin n=1 Tax=Mycolicibacterium sp. TaxID=2320850 RepID=UPI003D0E1138
MDVKIEPEKCVASGQCVLLADTVFDQDDDGIVVLLKDTVDNGEVDGVTEAAKVCPAAAIHLEG